jgi:prepilin-type processing-associated H-X9-DG protein
MHQAKGNLLFGDTHVEQRSSWQIILAINPAIPPSSGSQQPANPQTPQSPGDSSQNAPTSPPSQKNRPPQSPQASPASGSRSTASQTAGEIFFAADDENNSKSKTKSPSLINTPRPADSPPQSPSLDDEPDPPGVRFCQAFIRIGFFISFLWALIMLLLLLWKKIRERQAEDEEAETWFQTDNDDS